MLPVTRRCGSATADAYPPVGRGHDQGLARGEADMAQPVVANPLEPLYEGWQRGLVIVAHPRLQHVQQTARTHLARARHLRLLCPTWRSRRHGTVRER